MATPNGVVSFLAKELLECGAIADPQPRRSNPERDATPLGLRAALKPFSQGSREARQPWAGFRNRFAVGYAFGTSLHYHDASED